MLLSNLMESLISSFTNTSHAACPSGQDLVDVSFGFCVCKDETYNYMRCFQLLVCEMILHERFFFILAFQLRSHCLSNWSKYLIIINLTHLFHLSEICTKQAEQYTLIIFEISFNVSCSPHWMKSDCYLEKRVFFAKNNMNYKLG